eukprot:438149_1
MGQCLNFYGLVKAESFINNCYSVGVCSMRGYRDTMQDRYAICLSLPNHPSYSLFGVFDGFNGHSASQYLSTHLVDTINELNSLNDDKLIIDAINKMDKTFLKLDNENTAGSTFVFVLIDSNVNTQTSVNINENNDKNAQDMDSGLGLTEELKSNSLSIHSDKQQKDTMKEQLLNKDSMDYDYNNDKPDTYSKQKCCWCCLKNRYTALNDDYDDTYSPPQITAEIEISYPKTRQYKGRVFWVGDSAAVIMKENGKHFETLTSDHYCDLKKELERIKNANGEIINGKIDGICELSRCFGCYSMKNNKSLQDNQQKMISTAQCKHILFSSDETLILFSDGLTQKWNHNEVVKRYNFQYNQYKNEQKPIQNSLNYLIEDCIDCGSKDNITVVSVRFR